MGGIWGLSSSVFGGHLGLFQDIKGNFRNIRRYLGDFLAGGGGIKASSILQSILDLFNARGGQTFKMSKYLHNQGFSNQNFTRKQICYALTNCTTKSINHAIKENSSLFLKHHGSVASLVPHIY